MHIVPYAPTLPFLDVCIFGSPSRDMLSSTTTGLKWFVCTRGKPAFTTRGASRLVSTSTSYCRDYVRNHDYESYLIAPFYPPEAQDAYWAIKAFYVRGFCAAQELCLERADCFYDRLSSRQFKTMFQILSLDKCALSFGGMRSKASGLESLLSIQSHKHFTTLFLAPSRKIIISKG
jgi:hypothetical protein